jgi:transcriptional regulator with XRE-family HTH domain
MSVKFGDRIMQACEKKELSREERAEKIGTPGPIVDRYECVDMMPSIATATKIAEALEVSLDFLVGKSSSFSKRHNMLERLEGFAKLHSANETELFNVMDAYLRDYRTGMAYIK